MDRMGHVNRLDEIYHRLLLGEIPEKHTNYMSAALAELYTLDMGEAERAATILTSKEWRNISSFVMMHAQSILILAVAKKCGVL